ncbi:MAG TPA: LysE family translocator [Dissulfurispiraceae bacterium]|nr:LysE family translocator [Dissulfurispiraceae bacterium]
MLSAEFLITSFIVVLIPGTGVIYTISSGLFAGRRGGFYASIGCTLGIIPSLIASILGLAAIFHTSALAFQIVKYAGVAYLFYLAWTMWREKGSLQLSGSGPAGRGRHIAFRGFLMNILNPKLSIFFLAFMPQFISADAESPLLELLSLSAVFMLMTLVVFIVYGLLSHSVRQYVHDSPKILIWLQRSFAVVFAALGAKLALEEH